LGHLKSTSVTTEVHLPLQKPSISGKLQNYTVQEENQRNIYRNVIALTAYNQQLEPHKSRHFSEQTPAATTNSVKALKANQSNHSKLSFLSSLIYPGLP